MKESLQNKLANIRKHGYQLDFGQVIEQTFAIDVVTAHQAISRSGLRRCGVGEKITGFGRLLREF